MYQQRRNFWVGDPDRLGVNERLAADQGSKVKMSKEICSALCCALSPNKLRELRGSGTERGCGKVPEVKSGKEMAMRIPSVGRPVHYFNPDFRIAPHGCSIQLLPIFCLRPHIGCHCLASTVFFRLQRGEMWPIPRNWMHRTLRWTV